MTSSLIIAAATRSKPIPIRNGNLERYLDDIASPRDWPNIDNIRIVMFPTAQSDKVILPT